MNVALSFIVLKIVDKIDNTESELSEMYTPSLLYSIFYLGGIIIISHWINLNFNWFLIVAYSYIIFRIIVVFIADRYYNSK